MIAIRTFIVVVAGLVVTGCGASNKSSLRTYPVEGRVLVGGDPVPFAQIVFYPLDANATHRPVATADAEGRFWLTTQHAFDGAPEGDYSVTVFWPNDSKPYDECTDLAPHDRLMGAYTDPHARRLIVTVVPQDNTIDFKLTITTRGWDFTPKSK